MDILEAIILGIIQGLTEFLPVSSSGHLEIGSVLLNIQTTDNLLFSIVVHGATALSTIVVFRKDIIILIGDLFKFQWNESTQFLLKIFISIIPVFIIGMLFEEEIEKLFTGNLLLVGSMLLLTALLLSFTYFFRNKKGGSVNYWQATIIGISQAIAIIPGISRSGATIATAIILGVEKEKAARFSFLMVLIPILGASFLKTLDFLENPVSSNDTSSIVLIAGFLLAFTSGLIACRLMINIVKRGKLIYFAIYCAIVGIIAIISQVL